MSDPILSPSLSSAHPLPPRPHSSVTMSNSISSDQSQHSSAPPQSIPKIRGGFEVDDEDGDDQDIPIDDEQDDDVYDPLVPLVLNGAAPTGDQVSLDRSPKSPTQENGMTPITAQAFDSPADVLSSLTSNNVQSQNHAASNSIVFTEQLPSTDTPSVLPKSRLAHDVVGILEDRIKDDPRGDTAAWLELIEEYKTRNKTDQVRQTYERYMDLFPLGAEQLCDWLYWEEASDRKYQMEQIFNKFLMKVLNVKLYSIYVNYVRRRNNMQTGDIAKAYKTISDTFDFALRQVGNDPSSGTLWQEYINFLKSGPGTIGGTGWQDNQKMDTVREAYRRALCIPTSAIQVLWKEYDAFETSINKINGRKLMQELSSDYMTARSAFTALQNIVSQIERTTRPRLPPAMGYSGDVEYQQQVSLWTQWIQWEKEDKLYLKEDKLESYLDRVTYAYQQALMAMQFWPEMWYDAADFCLNNNRDAKGLEFLNQGFAANPESALLAFKLADHIESTSNNDEASDPGARVRMKKVREPYEKVLDALYAIDKKTESRVNAEIQRIETALQQEGHLNGEEELNASNISTRKAALDAQIEAARAGARVHLEMLSKIISHVWIALMRATRRIQGKGMPNEKGAGFRVIFNEARKRGKLTSDFYVESALIEWNCYRDPTGTRILERGVKLFPEDSYLPLEYIKHLIIKDDLLNARAVFETTVSRFTSGNNPAAVAKSKPLFVFFHDYESKYGELTQIVRLEARMRELFPEDPTLQQFLSRYHTTGFDPLSVHPIISATQTVPRPALQPSIEVAGFPNSPIQKVIDHITTINSPKRPYPTDDEDEEDSRPQKFARGESPFKSTIVRKAAQPQPQSQPQVRLPAPLPPPIMHILSILPKASLYTDTKFDPIAIHKLIRDVHLPPPGAISTQRPPQTPQLSTAPGWAHQYSQQPGPSMIPPSQNYAAPVPPQQQYGAAPFRYA